MGVAHCCSGLVCAGDQQALGSGLLLPCSQTLFPCLFVCATLIFEFNERSVVALAAVVIYHGQSVEAFMCPECVEVFAATGAKWHLLYRFTLLPEWQQYKQQYAAIMLPDDDLQVMHRGTQGLQMPPQAQASGTD